MTALAICIAIHGLIAGFGALMLRRLTPAARLLDTGQPHWLAAYPLGLVPNLLVAFVANQGFGLRLTPSVLMAIAAGWLCAAAALPRPGTAASAGPLSGRPPAASSAWHALEIGLLGAVAGVLAWRHAMGAPLSDWDSLMYHLPLADELRGGHFPSTIGRSYMRQYEAAFPPLLYFQYGLFPASVSVVAPRLFALAVNACLCWFAAHFSSRLLATSRAWALGAALLTAAVVNTEPNTQSVTGLYLLLTFVYGRERFEHPPGGTDRPAWHSLIPVALLGAGCYWNSYLGAGLLAVLYPALASGALARRLRGQPEGFDWFAWSGAAALTILLLTPHLARNFAVAGNPLYPALVEVLGGIGITEWFLANRPPAGTAIEGAWGLIALSFAHWRPMPQLLLGGAAATLFLRTLEAGRQTQLFVLLGGFFLVWMQIYQLENTPLDRYITPLAPVAAATLMALVARIAGARNARALLWAVPIVAVFATAVPTSDMLRSDPIGAPLFLLYLGSAILGAWGLDRWLEARANARTSERAAPLRGLEHRRVRASRSVPLVVALGVALLIGQSRWPEANQYRAPIADDLAWLNANLAPSSRVLLFDGRVLGLERDHLAIDDLRLEAFGQAQRPGTALKALRELGITHFYFSSEAVHLLPAGFKLDFFVPRDRNNRVELVYRSPTGWTVQLR